MKRDVALRAMRICRPILALVITTYVAVTPSSVFAQLTGLDGSAAGEAKKQGVLVMKNGRVVDGRISENPAGYMVEKENGNMIIPSDMVEFEAADLAEAHLKLQKRVPEQTPETRLNLARWCLANQLQRQAVEEVRAALDLDPEHEEAKTMLKRIEVQQFRENDDRPDENPKPVHTPDGFRPRAPESLSGLTTPTVREFSSRIQPILLNKCGNANCHGSSRGGDFQLTHPRGGFATKRRAIEDNLTAALRYVDSENPRQSPLLVTPQEGHGRNRRAVFLGERDEALLASLEQWVKLVVKERGGNEERSEKIAGRGSSYSTNKRKFDSDVIGASYETAPVFVDVPQTAFPRRNTGKPPAQSLQPGVKAQTAAKEKHARFESEPAEVAAESKPHDAFDPGAFNRERFGDKSAN